MENRLQHFLLKLTVAAVSIWAVPVSAQASSAPANTQDTSSINDEVLELGISAGVVNIDDFSSELALGVSATFRASEDFFLQYNYLQAEASASSYELSQGKLFDGSDRTFSHYDLLVGYNLLQGEFYPTGTHATLSAFYVNAGVGETSFGGEKNFTYTAGVGYQVGLTRRFIWQVDYRAYVYRSSLVTDDERTVATTHLSSGFKFLL